jgi:DNA-binding transcriptional MocR family regulator
VLRACTTRLRHLRRRPPRASPPAFLQVGWVTGPAALLAPITKAHQFLVFTVASNLQRAVAYGLDHEQAFYE